MSRSPVFGSTLLVHGSEPLLAERAVAARLNAARAEQPAAEVTEVAAADLADGRFSDLIGGSLFSSHSVVVITDLANLAEQALPLVKQVALNPFPELCLVLVHGGGVKGKGLLDALKKEKVARVAADPIKAWELPKFIAAEARELKMGMAPEAAEALVDAVGTDLRAITAALRQLSFDYEGRQLDQAMVHRYFSGRAEMSSFDIANDAMQGRAGPALEKLRWALDTGTAPVLIVGAMASSLRGLGKYLELRNSQLSENDLARQVGVPPWKLKELNRLSRDWSSAGVSTAIRALARADEEVKGAAADPGFALEQLLLTVHAARAAGRRG